MSVWYFVWVPFLLAWAVSWFLVKFSPKVLLDYPNPRSLHTRPIPRGGGAGVVIGTLSGVAVFVMVQGGVGPGLRSLLAVATLLAILSFIDDLRSLSPALRLMAQIALSGGWLAWGFWLHSLALPGWEWQWPRAIGILFSWLWLVWMTNLYNFMDGMDGLAAGMGIFGFGVLSWFGLRAGNVPFAFLNMAIVMALLAFLLFNFPPARLFLGDVGSTFLGFSAAALILVGHEQQLFPFWLGTIPFWPFIVDATVTLLRRVWKGEKIWQAHKTHFYQRFVQAGWGHRYTLFGEYFLMALSAAMAVWLVSQEPSVQKMGVGGLISVYGTLLWVSDRYLAARGI